MSSSDPRSRTHPRELPRTCGACHRKDSYATEKTYIGPPPDGYLHGVHGKALLAGDPRAPSCSTCHDSHAKLRSSNPRASTNKFNIAKTCGRCHIDVAKEYNESIHGKALTQGRSDAPTCTNCHGEHDILLHDNIAASTFYLNIAKATCGPCHGIPKLNRKYGIIESPLSSYLQSYHGLAVDRGSMVAANCTSCHGVHRILASTDSKSSTHRKNLKKTCSKCHDNATESDTHYNLCDSRYYRI